ncbi:MAG: rhomboid family intramembrane serine protease [Candidatus Thiodiazotropha sp. 6PLUC2]
MSFTTITKISGRKDLPLATILLILTTLSIFIIWQLDDNSALSEILSDYQSSGLHEYEKRQYEAYLEKYMTVPSAALSKLDDTTQWEQFVRIQSDTTFQFWLWNGNFDGAQNQDHLQWKEKHSQLIKRFSDVTYIEYGLVAGKMNGVSLFGHMFLHAGIIHLLSNLFVLGLLGLMVERLLGRVLFLGIYLTSGLVAAILALSINPAGLLHMVGAGGAISGVLGMATVILGRRKIALFELFGINANQLALPLFVILPFWIAIELIQLALYSESQIQYLTHIGCFLITATVTLLLKHTQWVFGIELSDEAEGASDVTPRLASAKDLCQSENHKEALRLLRRLYREATSNSEFLSLYYQCSRALPESEDFHRAARAIFSLDDRDSKSVDLIRATYIDYVRLAQPGPRFTENILYRLAELFVDRKWCDEVDGIMSLMHKKRAACLFASNLPYRYAKLLDEQGRTVDGTEYLKSIV